MKYVLSFLFITLSFVACKKDNQDSPSAYSYNKPYSVTTAPEALSKNDSSTLGIYKGVAINTQDSLGTFKFNLNNNNDGIYSLFYADNVIKDSLIRFKGNPSNLQSPDDTDNAAIDVKVGFFGNFYSYHHTADPMVSFGVNPTGTSAVINAKLYKNYTVSAAIKETSANQVFCYEGDYSGADFGKIAFVVSANTVINVGTSLKNRLSFKNISSVNISGGKFILPGQILNVGLVTFTGTYDSNMLTGTWVSNSNPSVINTFSAKRTL